MRYSLLISYCLLDFDAEQQEHNNTPSDSSDSPTLHTNVTHSLTHSLTPSLTPSLTHSLTPSLTPSLTHCFLTHSLSRHALPSRRSPAHLPHHHHRLLPTPSLPHSLTPSLNLRLPGSGPLRRHSATLLTARQARLPGGERGVPVRPHGQQLRGAAGAARQVLGAPGDTGVSM